MIILLGIAGELVTVIGSIAITLNGILDSVLEISKNGYKIDKSMLETIQSKQAEEKKSNLAKRILGFVLLLIPGINLINASVKATKLKKMVINDPEIKEVIIPMTEKEKEQFAGMESKLQRLIFTVSTVSMENEEEFLGFIGKTPIVVDHGLASLYYEELMHLDYTFDEVKRLNEATTFSYRIGKIDGKNVAIIGIPNPDSLICRIQFKSEDYKITHNYEKMTEDEAQDKTFMVYPYTKYDDTQGDVEKVIQEIKKSRIDSAVKANLEALKLQPKIEHDIITSETAEILTEEQGPRLVKTKHSQNDKK